MDVLSSYLMADVRLRENVFHAAASVVTALYKKQPVGTFLAVSERAGFRLLIRYAEVLFLIYVSRLIRLIVRNNSVLDIVIVHGDADSPYVLYELSRAPAYYVLENVLGYDSGLKGRVKKFFCRCLSFNLGANGIVIKVDI